MKIPPAATAAPQATAASAHAIASGKDSGASLPSGFAQALFAAGFADAASSLPPPVPGTSQLSTGSNRNAKGAKEPPAKESSKDNRKNTLTVPVMSSLQATLAPPLRILPFSREPESHEASNQTLPAETPAPAPAPAATSTEARGETAKPEVIRAASAESVRPASNQPAPGNPPPAPSGDLAFAARVQPAQAPAPGGDAGSNPRALQHEITAAEQAKKAVEKDAADPTTAVQPIAAGAEASLSSQGQQASLGQYASPEVAASHTAAPSAPAEPAAPLKPVETHVPETPAKAAAGPLKDISLQVVQSGDQKVEIRMVQQSGELRVAVRTGDSDLAHGLQQGLSDLVGRLQDNGFRTEAWRPGGSTVQSGPVLETRSSNSSQNGDQQSNSGGSQQQQGERRQHQSQRPGWVEELENTIAGGVKSQGVTYGIRS